jgi:hypothetical protein
MEKKLINSISRSNKSVDVDASDNSPCLKVFNLASTENISTILTSNIDHKTHKVYQQPIDMDESNVSRVMAAIEVESDYGKSFVFIYKTLYLESNNETLSIPDDTSINCGDHFLVQYTLFQ